ncbi:MAG: crossover junction endodeoxyribonuclease RuvC [Bdellovibrionaceae bacterium]|nr:crossover junction endodeoxyribonuclease RuvC [Bdellovibrionales bacterium]MCB9255443.1 crossover junction endodeoxyribonuclease RuvC [Pseudobdellovibrionaceae bacterium]
MRRVLGIDPGSHRLGVGCLVQSGQSIRLLAAEVIEAPRKESLYPRLGVIQARLIEFIDQWQPHEAAIEDLFQHRNARSAFHLGMARGIAVAACLQRKIHIYEYAPAKIKSMVAGSGRADKEQVKKMTEMQLGHRLDLGYDATDAIAAALCHVVSPRLDRMGIV